MEETPMVEVEFILKVKGKSYKLFISMPEEDLKAGMMSNKPDALPSWKDSFTYIAEAYWFDKKVREGVFNVFDQNNK